MKEVRIIRTLALAIVVASCLLGVHAWQALTRRHQGLASPVGVDFRAAQGKDDADPTVTNATD